MNSLYLKEKEPLLHILARDKEKRLDIEYKKDSPMSLIGIFP
jgi:hypothetical protein